MSFAKVAARTARWSGHPAVVVVHIALFLLWGVWGPFVDYSDAWQLVLNTATSIVTTLMVLLIQNSQTRDTDAVQLKLDELIRVTAAARNALIAAERDHDLDLDQLREKGPDA